MLTTKILTEISQINQLIPAWEELLETSSTNQVFLRPEFLINWWQAYGHGQLKFITIYDSKKLVAIGPLFICSDTNNLKFVGCKAVSDYLDFIIDQDYLDQALLEITVTINKFPINKIEFCSIPEKSTTLTLFKKIMEDKGWQTEVTAQDVCPVINLPTSWDDYLINIDRKQRHEIRRKWKKLASEQQLEFEILTDSQSISQGIDQFINLHQKSSTDKARFWNDEHRQFFRQISIDLAKRDITRLYFAKVNGERVATMLIFDYHNNYYLYNSGFDPDLYSNYGVGNVLTAYTIQDAINNGKKIYDFLRGDEKYKFKFGAQKTKVFDMSGQRIPKY